MPVSNAAKPASKSTLADWAADDDDVNGFYVGEKRQRGGRKRRKKNREEQAVAQDWEDIYDPSRPNNYEEYKNSDEKVREVREWKDRLYAHRMARKTSSDSDDEESYRPKFGSKRPLFLFPIRMLMILRPIRSTCKLFICSSADRFSSQKAFQIPRK